MLAYSSKLVSAAANYLVTPEGSWGQTQQAWERLVDAAYRDLIIDDLTESEIESEVDAMIDRAIEEGATVRSSRRKTLGVKSSG